MELILGALVFMLFLQQLTIHQLTRALAPKPPSPKPQTTPVVTEKKPAFYQGVHGVTPAVDVEVKDQPR